MTAMEGSAGGPVPVNWNRRMWRLAGPIILSNLSVPLLGIADTAVVGHLPDPAYLGAVAIGALVFSYVYWGFGFLRMGTTGLSAQAYGMEDSDESRAVLFRAGAIALGIGACIVLLQIPIRTISLSLISASDQVEYYAAEYIQIRIWGAPATLLSYVFLGWFVGRQDARTPLVLQLWTNGVNILLDIVFVIGFDMGVAGVAYATVIAEVSGALLGIYFIRRHFRRSGWAVRTTNPVFTWPAVRRLIALNSDIFIRTLCLITAFAWFTAKGASMGDVTLAANAVLMNFFTFAAYGLDGFAHAAEALVGGAVGKRNRADFQAAARTAFLWSGVVAALVSAVYLLAGPLIIDGLTGIAEVREAARDYLVWAAVTPLIANWAFMLDGIFIGATRSRALRNAMVLSLSGYLLADYLLRGAFGNDGLWMAMLVFNVLRGLTLLSAYPALLASVEVSRDAAGPQAPQDARTR